jgi:hypothetical protein
VKLQSNNQIISLAKKGGAYTEIAQLVDHNYSMDVSASVNYQEVGTGFTALHYAVKNGDH